MTHRKRLQNAINHREADRVAIDNNGLVTGMHEIAYKELLSFLQLDNNNIEITDPVQRLAAIREDLLDFLGVDTRYLFPNEPSFWKYSPKPDGSFFDEFGTYYKRCGYYSDFSKPVLADASFEDIKKYQFPNPRDSSRFDGLYEKSKQLYEETDYALVGGYLPSIYYNAWVLRGMEQFLEDTLLRPKLADYLMDKIMEYHINFLDEYLSKVGKYIELQWIGDDWGLQHGTFLSPKMMKESIIPRFKKIITFIKSKTNAKVIYHSCGATYDLLNDFLEMGVDVIQPVQANALGNENAQRLKKDFGDRIVFHGNTNNQGVFHKSKEEVMADALYRIKNLAPGGGYIFSSGHNIQANMPPESILTLFNTAKEYGKYPIDIPKIDKKLGELLKIRPEIKLQLPHHFI